MGEKIMRSCSSASRKTLKLLIYLLSTWIVAAFFVGLSSCRSDPPCVSCPSSDSTSHDIAWTLTELGDGNGSVLYDVAIIRENPPLVYAVGEISLRDSAGNWQNPPFGVAKWDGTSWTFHRVFALYPNSTTPLRPTGLLVLSASDLWFGWGDVFHWDGLSETVTIHRLTIEPTNPEPVLATGQAISKVWGSSNQDVYGIGTKGALVHYDGSKWTKIETGTTLDIQDIWSDGTEILAVASNPGSTNDRKILRLAGTAFATVADTPIAYPLSSVWFSSGSQYYVVGDGIYQKTHLSDSLWRNDPLDITRFGATRIRGSSIKDIFVVGAFGECLHFNGSSWKSFYEQTSMDGSFTSLAMKGDLVVAVGASGPRAVVAVGRR